MSELKAQLQAVQKKTAEKTSVKSSSSSDSDSDGGSFMIFVIGLLCGLTVVLSSLAIYNFLSNEPAKTDAAHGAPPADTQGEQAADKQSADVKHDAPAKDKSH
jgi:hypothetical protein